MKMLKCTPLRRDITHILASIQLRHTLYKLTKHISVIMCCSRHITHLFKTNREIFVCKYLSKKAQVIHTTPHTHTHTHTHTKSTQATTHRVTQPQFIIYTHTTHIHLHHIYTHTGHHYHTLILLLDMTIRHRNARKNSNNAPPLRNCK